jgi:thioredoxin 1
MPITHIKSVSELNGILSQSKDKLSVIDFHATWCGPCHAIAPHFESLSAKHTNVNFLKCDVDEARDVAALYKVSAMPTFIFLKGDTKVDQVRGADKAGLTNTITKHASSSSSSSAFTGKGQTLGSSSSTNSSTPTNDTNTNTPGASLIDTYWTRLDPQTKVFAGLIAAYALFWYLS